MVLDARSAALAVALWLGLASAQAITLGQSDGFQDGTTQGWFAGGATALPPTYIADGGPAGAGDGFLLLGSSGVQGPGGKLVALAGSQWLGDYLAAGVSGIDMDLRNLGSTDLSLRLLLGGAGNVNVISLTPVPLAAGGGWTHVHFDLSPAALTAGALPVLGGVIQLRIFHAPDALFPGPNIEAQLGVDNISAVPEPGRMALLLGGLAMLAMRRRRRAD